MNVDYWFSMSGNLAMLGWLMLAFFPWRSKWVFALTGMVIPAILALAYAVFLVPNFISIEGAGYGSLAQVSALFSDPRLLLAGWIHFLAFDLAVGTYVALQSDKCGLSRIIQVPILFLTFMFGPIGYLVFVLLNALTLGSDKLVKGGVS